MSLFDSFLIRAALAGLGVALAAAPLGCFVVWRRMAYFGDTLSHSALLGVVFGVLLGIHIWIGVIAVGLSIVLIVLALRQQHQLADDTLLGILAHSNLAIGLLGLSFLDTPVSLINILFGNIAATDSNELIASSVIAVAVILFLSIYWRKLVLMTLHEDIAKTDGLPILRLQFSLMAIMALVVSIAMQFVGILLVTALLIIPAATSRRFSSTPEQMALLSIVFGIAAVLMGIGGSWWFDLQTGPAIVVASFLMFLGSYYFSSEQQ